MVAGRASRGRSQRRLERDGAIRGEIHARGEGPRRALAPTPIQAGMAQMIRASMTPPRGEAAWIAYGDERGLSDDGGATGVQDL